MPRLRVLIGEDEGLTSLRLRTTLTRCGHDVVGTHGDGMAVVDAAIELQPDAILMDVEMPGLDGISATRRIMEVRPTAILIVSAYSDRESIQAAIAAGAAGYLVKPVSDEQLEPALAAAAAQFASLYSESGSR